MISRDTFVHLIDGVQRQFEADERIGHAVDRLTLNTEDGPSNNPFVFVTPLNDTVVRALEAELHDDHHNISYYIYDTEFGKKADEFYLTLADGSEVKFYTAADVYDYLTGLGGK